MESAAVEFGAGSASGVAVDKTRRPAGRWMGDSG